MNEQRYTLDHEVDSVIIYARMKHQLLGNFDSLTMTSGITIKFKQNYLRLIWLLKLLEFACVWTVCGQICMFAC